MFPKVTLFLSCVGVVSSFMTANRGLLKIPSSTPTKIDMSVYSPEQGILSQLVEDRDACGVGFIANLSQKPSHSILAQAVEACNCMEHRGATSADNISGDGAGILTAIPWKLYSDLIDHTQFSNKDGSTAAAVGQIFLPRNQDDVKTAMAAVESSITAVGLKLVGWRDVPVDPSVLGKLSGDFVPTIKQVVVVPVDGKQFDNQEQMDKVLYESRRKIQGLFRMNTFKEAYVCSFSSRTIVYKGMLRSCDLPLFYKDLTNPDYESVFAVYHRRFSTNTVPKWFLAQPMRMLAHNGEINTLLGNINWVKSKQYAKRNEIGSNGVFIENEDLFIMKGKDEENVIGPLVDTGRSDSANLDSIIETFVKAGKSPEEALMILVPEAYASQPTLETMPDLKAFYSYYESLQEAWDGPALLVFSDGDMVGAALDRNGLRPARYMVVADGTEETIHVMSEVGVTKSLDLFAGPGGGHLVNSNLKLIDSGRVGPGQMISVNLRDGTIGLNDDIKNKVAKKNPYQKWAQESLIESSLKPFYGEVKLFADNFVTDQGAKTLAISKLGDGDYYSAVTDEVDNENLIQMQSAFGWGVEDVEIQISAMAGNAVEATYCMGDDAPLAALSSMPHILYDYFKQRFAQVTNPPIDPLREGAVMSLNMFLGPRGDPLSDGQSSKRVKIESPVMNFDEVAALKATEGVKVTKINTLYPLKEALTQGGLQAALDRLSAEAIQAVKDGATVLDLSDIDLMAANEGNKRGSTLFIPPLLAVANVHHGLIAAGLRTSASLIVSTGQAWSTHHIATLVGYGASAVVPYAAYNAVINWHSQKRVQNSMERGDIPKISASKALSNYRKALDKGLLKILSKMGISLLTSYHGAQIFEALGISDDVISSVFKGTPSRLGGLSMDDIAAEGAEFHRKTYGDEIFAGMIEKVEGSNPEAGVQKKLFNYGFLNYFKSGEYHHNNQPLIKQLHAAIRDHDRDLYNLYEQDVQNRPVTTLRDTLAFNTNVRQPIPLEEVEPIEEIMKRFCTGGMSLGALSREAHETLAIALNRIGGKSNSGEGGEDFVRSKPLNDVGADGISPTLPHLKGLENGDLARSKIKQIASGRFGVTAQYLMTGDQLEIKVAQGAKPGEGGQLPGAKIDSYIAGLRKSKPGVTLISPPPHHDIYSIEDLAQLIYDLHQVNEKAGVSVKLVSEVGIGTVASGVAKAGADIIQISGHDGGTGASPVSSIKHAGSAWELGLVEAHATLMSNGLRDRVLLRVDGGLKSGWDVVMAALMGAEEFGFGTIAMIAEGCIMARICHTNKCPVGITTQNEALRKRFPGTPDNIVTFFSYVAEEVRHILAKLGYRSLDEIIGQPGMLQARENIKLKKLEGAIDTSFIITSINDCQPATDGLDLCDLDRNWLTKPAKPYSNGYTFDDKLLEDSEIKTALEANDGKTIHKKYHLVNTDRSAFARLAGQIAVRYGDDGFKGSMKFDLTGAAGQSFGAFLCTGIDTVLNGYANDYVCKGMSGGSVVVNPPRGTSSSKNARPSNKHSCVGNTVLYGASGGSLLVRGRAGERFAVRNSGALGIVEGLGDHGCEYMTAGTVIALGNTGRNFGAGMTGGLAFVLDDESWLEGDLSSEGEVLPFSKFVNDETCSVSKLSSDFVNAKAFLEESLTKHYEATGSDRSKHVLDNLDEAMGKFWAVVPNSEKANPIIQNSKAPQQAVVNK